MTSTQRSESANHVLKIYIPCNSSINRFVAQYSKLINDRESSDHECEKNTKQKSIELQVGYPIEKHASLIYTRKVYQLFKMELLKSTKYVIVPRKENNIFEVKHVQAELRDSWCKVNYVIDVQDPVGFYKCECGLYEHFGIVCSHIIAVFIHRGVCSIPDCHIMKRWTRQARMSKYNPNLRNLAKDRIMESRSFRHKVVYMSAMELVNQAEVDEKSCEIANRNIERGKKEIEEYRLSKLRTCQVGYGDCSGTSNAADANGADDTMDCTEVGNPGLEIFDRSKNIGIPVCSIKAPLIKKKDGRPTNRRFLSRLDANIKKKKPAGKAKRSKDPGGLSGVVQSRFCSKCKSLAHNITGCPKMMLEDGPN
ncbi:protein FAR1-RELATED SEQUENCE 5-like [Lolium perenne]|uniref:protein FAR1-RELATED SEQUENCE 5-like n=1 Tax=Lolium perenne TaxID=4522 RepID=UPI0021F57632|nr:protein FAR1-RELATED SEQUENCE 5-like [Lolium perenne]